MQVFTKKTLKNLVNSKKSSTFAPAFRKKEKGRSPWGPRKFPIFGESAAQHVASSSGFTASHARVSVSEILGGTTKNDLQEVVFSFTGHTVFICNAR